MLIHAPGSFVKQAGFCLKNDKWTENTVYLNLGTPAEQWSKQIEKFYNFKRKDECTSVIEHGFDIKVASQKLFAWFERI